MEARLALLLPLRVQVVRQVPMLQRCADLVAVMPGRLAGPWAIECKLTGWRRGIEQARRYLHAAPYALVALPMPTGHSGATRSGAVAACQEAGIGLVGVSLSRWHLLVTPQYRLDKAVWIGIRAVAG